MTRGWWIAAGVVVVANAATIGSAAWNRGGEPEAVLELTERELQLPPAQAENTAVALRVQWTDPADRHGEGPAGAGWFDQAKLEEAGFDCSLPLDETNLGRYRATPPRRTFAVLEYDGEAWRALERAIPEAPSWPALSRLVVVDVGPDRAALRARWPDRRRAVVMPAVAALLVKRGEEGRPFLRGRVTAVFPAQLNVPRPLNRVLLPLHGRATEPARARYHVKVVWGRRDPWIADVR